MDVEERRIERERVLTLLYEAEMKQETIDEVLAELPMQPEDFVLETVKGVNSTRNDLDLTIEQHLTTSWAIDRIASIDLNIMRIGTWELQNRPDLPTAVILNEAVELAKKFSTEEASRLVNGVLQAISARR